MTAQEMIARMRARATATFGMVNVPGRPEELVKPGTNLGISLAYGCGEVRLRLMHSRTWTQSIDFQIKNGWQSEFDRLVAGHLGLPAEPGVISWSVPPRPIRDNPQA